MPVLYFPTNFIIAPKLATIIIANDMNSFFKAFKFAKEKPRGCSVASIISLAMMAGVLAGAFGLFFAFISVKTIKDSITASTGFYPICENAFVNVFNGECTFDGIILYNPSAYNSYQNKTDSLSEDMMAFAKLKKIKMRISPFKIFVNKLEISSFSAEIEKLNCFRINQSNYNLQEFLTCISKMISVPDKNGTKVLKSFSLKIQNAEYIDISSPQNLLRMKSSKQFYFAEEEIVDFNKFLTKLKDALSECRASFISNSIKGSVGK